MAPRLEPISTKQFLITLEDLTAYFTKATSPKTTKDEEEYNDGTTGQTRVHLAFIKLDKVTIAKPYNPKEDAALLQWVEDTFKTAKRFSCSIQAVSADLDGTPIAGAKTLVLAECQLVSRKYPEADRMGSGSAMLELEIMPETMTLQ